MYFIDSIRKRRLTGRQVAAAGGDEAAQGGGAERHSAAAGDVVVAVGPAGGVGEALAEQQRPTRVVAVQQTLQTLHAHQSVVVDDRQPTWQRRHPIEIE